MTDQAENLRRLSGRACTGFISPEAFPNIRVIAVTSGKGGVGKTNLVLNLALVLAKLDYKVVVIDADLGMANIDILINAVPRHTLADVIDSDVDIRDAVIHGPLGIKIVPGGSGLFDLANLDQTRRNLLLDRMQVLEQGGDLILLDTAAGISCSVLSFVSAADEIIIVTTPEPTAITDAYGMIKTIFRLNLKQKLYLVVNCIDHWQQGEGIFMHIREVVERYLPGMEIRYLGGVRQDPVVSKAVRQYSPFVLSHPRSAAAASVMKIGRRLMAGDVREPEEQKPGFFRRLKSYFQVGVTLD